MCDAFLVLAQADGGISCFLFPRWTPDGKRNRFRLQRLKDKLGNRSNASSEIEFDSASAWLVGEEGAGVRTIIEMVNHTRLDCVIGGSDRDAGGGRAERCNHTAQRSVFGEDLIDQPLMRNVLADLSVESEAATISAMRLARAYDEALAGDEEAAEFKPRRQRRAQVLDLQARPGPCGRVPRVPRRQRITSRSRGCRDSYRESPLDSIWEGSGNVQCLDVLRAMVKSPTPSRPSSPRCSRAPAPNRGSTATSPRCAQQIPGDIETIQARARSVVERMALALQASLLVRYGDPASADAFCASRLGGDWGNAFGTLPAGTDFGRIIERHQPVS